MVRDPARWGSLLALMFGSVSVALLAVASQVTPPNVESVNGERRPVVMPPEVLDQYVGSYVRGASRVLSISRDRDHLRFQQPNLPPSAVYPYDDKTFLDKNGDRLPLAVVREASGRVNALIWHATVGDTTFSVPAPRIDASSVDAIKANNELRARSQTPMPGSEAALRRLIAGIVSGKPNYDEMTPFYAELVREGGSITRSIYGKRGAVRSIEFRHVDEAGGDVYQVRQDFGFSTWIIYLNSNGLIEDAEDHADE